jgi:flagellin
MKLSATSKRQGAVANNLGNAVSYLQTQDGGLKITGKILDRISELKTLYGDVTKSANDKANYDTEFVALTAQLTSIGTGQFNGINLFGTGALAIVTTEDASTASSVTLTGRDLTGTASTTGVTSVVAATSLSTIGLTTITGAIQNIASMRANSGADLSRLSFATELLTTNKANLEAATSRITDVDVAEESTQLARWNTLVSAGTSMLTQANQSAQTALKLLQ